MYGNRKGEYDGFILQKSGYESLSVKELDLLAKHFKKVSYEVLDAVNMHYVLVLDDEASVQEWCDANPTWSFEPNWIVKLN